MLGGWTCIRDIVRCGWATWTNTPLIPAEDLTWLATWSNVEITVGIIIACLPSARLVVVRYLPKKIKEWNETNRTTRSSHTRSSKGGSIVTWVSGHSSGKRESNAQPSVPPPDAPQLDGDRTCSTQVSVSSPGVPDAVHQPGANSSVASELGRRESELPLVPGFESSRPAPVAADKSFQGVDETSQAPTPVAKDRRIWVEQHIYVSNDPVTRFSTEISRGDDEGSTPPWIAKLPGNEDA